MFCWKSYKKVIFRCLLGLKREKQVLWASCLLSRMLILRVWLLRKRLAGRGNPDKQSIIFDSRYLEACVACSCECFCAGIFRMMLRRNLANDVAKLRIRKEKDFNITFFSDKIYFLWDKSCCFIRNRYLCTIYKLHLSKYGISCISTSMG